MSCNDIIELEVLEDETNMELDVEFKGDIIRLGNGGEFTETDPTVPDWAKQPEKPTYTAEEVGASPADLSKLHSYVTAQGFDGKQYVYIYDTPSKKGGRLNLADLMYYSTKFHHIRDDGDYFSASNVEDALQEIGQNISNIKTNYDVDIPDLQTRLTTAENNLAKFVHAGSFVTDKALKDYVFEKNKFYFINFSPMLSAQFRKFKCYCIATLGSKMATSEPKKLYCLDIATGKRAVIDLEAESITVDIVDNNQRITNIENTLDELGTLENGKSAYEIAVDNGFEGGEAEWLESLKGVNGQDGSNGIDGKDGLTPFINNKGTWQIGDVDTGVKAEGADGKDGIGISSVEKNIDNELIVVLTDGSIKELGNIKGDRGPQGEQGLPGEKGEDGAGIDEVYILDDNLYIKKSTDTEAINLGSVKGDPATNIIQSVNGKTGEVQLTTEDIGALSNSDVDKTYNPKSDNPQSGKAVSEAVNAIVEDLGELADYCHEEFDKKADRTSVPTPSDISTTAEEAIRNMAVVKDVTQYTLLNSDSINTSHNLEDLAIYVYIGKGMTANSTLKDIKEVIIGDIDTALDELHNYAQNLISGGATE